MMDVKNSPPSGTTSTSPDTVETARSCKKSKVMYTFGKRCDSGFTEWMRKQRKDVGRHQQGHTPSSVYRVCPCLPSVTRRDLSRDIRSAHPDLLVFKKIPLHPTSRFTRDFNTIPETAPAVRPPASRIFFPLQVGPPLLIQ